MKGKASIVQQFAIDAQTVNVVVKGSTLKVSANMVEKSK